jgi:Spy/CpxP family protein refolding chaperone
MTLLHSWRGRLQAAALTGAAIALVSVGSVAARQNPQERPGGPGMRPPFPFHELNLTADQKTRVQAITQKHREANQEIFEQLRTARQSLRAATFATSAPDQSQIDTLIDQVNELEGKALRARVATEVEIASVLTDEQRQKLAAMQPPGPRGMRGMRGPRWHDNRGDR